MLKQLLVTAVLSTFIFADTAVISPTQSGKLTHSFLCCGFNTYYNSVDEMFWIGDCNQNVFGCVSSSLAGVWRWDLSDFADAEIHSAEVDFSSQSSNCTSGADVSFGPITGSMNSSQAIALHNSPPQSTSSSLYSGVLM